MDLFRFDLVSPERVLFSDAVEHVVVPGQEGEFGVLAHHAPLIALLKPGILTVLGPGQPRRMVLGGGFAEVGPNGLTVLAELAVPIEDFDRASLAVQIKDTEDDIADASDAAARDKARLRLKHLEMLQEALG